MIQNQEWFAPKVYVTNKDEKRSQVTKGGQYEKSSTNYNIQTTAALFSKQLVFSNIWKSGPFKNNFPKVLLKNLRKLTKLITSSIA